jgi:hypothetical protein
MMITFSSRKIHLAPGLPEIQRKSDCNGCKMPAACKGWSTAFPTWNLAILGRENLRADEK